MFVCSGRAVCVSAWKEVFMKNRFAIFSPSFRRLSSRPPHAFAAFFNNFVKKASR
ncbi:hypothetical protein [Methanimicrococcus hongohii]|uniref:hypothetical protein n=1 Tax=Methanimicrococcus hongohii TaxID=3028295 RepID=UPI00292D79A4|nr:hypothetical protein [Methanimicrococcus sp. Hf6]